MSENVVKSMERLTVPLLQQRSVQNIIYVGKSFFHFLTISTYLIVFALSLFPHVKHSHQFLTRCHGRPYEQQTSTATCLLVSSGHSKPLSWYWHFNYDCYEMINMPWDLNSSRLFIGDFHLNIFIFMLNTHVQYFHVHLQWPSIKLKVVAFSCHDRIKIERGPWAGQTEADESVGW